MNENKELQNGIPNNEPTEKEVKEAERKGLVDKNINKIVNDVDTAKYNKVLKEAKLPTVVKDEDFLMGDGEIDIRELSEKNYRQLMQRYQIITTARLQSIDTTLLDILRLFMIFLKKHGVEDITKELDILYEEMQNELKNKTTK